VKFIESFLSSRKRDNEYVLEIGKGEHISRSKTRNYYIINEDKNVLRDAKLHHNYVQGYIADIQRKTNIPNSFFDRVIAVNILENMVSLQDAINEIDRILKPTGEIDVVIKPASRFTMETINLLKSKYQVVEERWYPCYLPVPIINSLMSMVLKKNPEPIKPIPIAIVTQKSQIVKWMGRT
jgi:ubiquinone/menaquinone biosynthesis C-methylase UbiE